MAFLNKLRSLCLNQVKRPSYFGVCTRRFSSAVEVSKGNKKEEAEFATLADDEEAEDALMEREAVVQAMRNKSRLTRAHQNIVHGIVPYDEPMSETHLTLTYKKRMFGRYGRSSGLDPGYLWPSREEIVKKTEYDRIANPYGVLELAAKEQAKLDEEDRLIQERQKRIAENMKRLDQWKKEVHERAAKRLAEVSAAKAKKEALLEEVRRHFGFKIDPRDERFKEVLLQKEKLMKKKQKEEKAKAKQDKLLELMAKETGKN